MLEKAIATTRRGKYANVQCARFADDLVVLIDSHPRHEWLMGAVEKRLREELAKLKVEINEEKSRKVDLSKGGSFGFLGFEYRRMRSFTGKWRAHYVPKLKKRTALLRKLKEIFRRYVSQPKSGRAQLESLSLAPWATRRRHDLLELLDRLNPTIEELSATVEQEAKQRPEGLRLMTHPGVGPTTALAFVLIIDSAERFAGGKQIASYVGLIPCEDSSSDRRRLGHITKQGNTLLRFLLVEAAQAVVRRDPDWRRRYTHLAMRRDQRIAKVAMARKLAVRLYWMMRKEWNYEQLKKFGSHAEESEYVNGVQ